MNQRALLGPILFALPCFWPSVAAARSGGIWSGEFTNGETGCRTCHTVPVGETPPAVALTKVSGDVYQVTLTPTPTRSWGGFNVSTNLGTLSVDPADTGVQPISNDLTHKGGPRQLAAGATTISWRFQWKGCGTGKLVAWSNNVNRNFNNQGDISNRAELNVTGTDCSTPPPPPPTPMPTVVRPGLVPERIAIWPTSANPIGMTWTSDGRMFVWDQSGVIRIVKNGALLATPFLDISAKVNWNWDRGLMGLAIGPSNQVYVLYVYDGSSPSPADSNQRKTMRISRFSPDPANPDVGLPNSELVLVGTSATAPCPNDGSDCIPADSGSHDGGALAFGADGKLYVSIGDGGSWFDPAGAPQETFWPGDWNTWPLRAQRLNSYSGKVLRVNSNGTAPADNPFYDGTNSVRSKIYAYGLRNPFRFGMEASTHTIYAGDVGWGWEEEINRIERGGNYGWPCFEGPDRMGFYAQFSECSALTYAQTKAATYTYTHGEAGSCALGGPVINVISNVTAVNKGAFIADFSSSKINWIIEHWSGTKFYPYATDAGQPAGLAMGPDGFLYYASIAYHEIRRFRRANTPPVISSMTVTPAAIKPGTLVSVAAAVSDDFVPTPKYWMDLLWKVTSGPAPSINPSGSAMLPALYRFFTPGQYRVQVQFDDGEFISAKDVLVTVSPGWLYIKRFTDAMYLDVQWNSPAPQTPVWAWPLTDTSAQHWVYDPTLKTIKNENNNCLEVQGNGSANGTPVWMNTCNGAAAQQWTFLTYAADKYGIRNANGKCLDAPGGQNQVPLQIRDCDAAVASVHWTLNGAP